MRRTLYLAMTAATLAMAACDGDDDVNAPNLEERYTAALTGAAERPNPVTTTATGTATVRYDPTARTFSYTLTVSNLTNVTAAHIHGPATTEQAAGVIVPLATPSAPSVTGTFGAQQITNTSVSVDSLVALLRAGRAYVNVHTTQNTPGEIRGQLQRQQ
jgi:hypothetical protein